jgi:uncharacterized protein YbjT (DUF2867 family)
MTTAPPTTSVLDGVATWPGVGTRPTPRGATAIVLDGHELGHVHADRRTLDMPLSSDRRERVLTAGRANKWFSSWVSKPLTSNADAQVGIAMLRESYDERRTTQRQPAQPPRSIIMILVTTAGKVGSEAARQLAQSGEQVRVLVRSPEKASALTQAGANVFEGDLEVPASVDEAMHGISRVILVTAPVVHQELNVIDSAVRAGVEHVVKITTKASADSPIARRRNHAEIENALIASGLGYTLLRNNAYMQNFLMMAPAIANTDSFSTATGNGRIGHIDGRDVAAVAAHIAASPSAHAGKTYWPTGPEVLSGTEVATVLTQVLGRTITFQPITFEQQQQAMITAGLPEPIAEDNATAVALMADGDLDYTTDDVPSILGRPARTFEQFAADYAAAFSGPQPPPADTRNSNHRSSSAQPNRVKPHPSLNT